MILRVGLVGLVCTAAMGTASGEVPILPESALKKQAKEIFVGEVLDVFQKDPKRTGFRRVDYVASIKVDTVEKGKPESAGQLVYVHYWNQVGPWPRGLTGTRGHQSNAFKKGVRVTVYLRSGNDGQREVLLPNGVRSAKRDTRVRTGGSEVEQDRQEGAGNRQGT